MTFKNLLLQVIFFLAASGAANGQYIPMKDPEVFRQRFLEVAKNTSSLEANFIQEKDMSVLSEKIISKGRFLFKKENKLRWEYTDPYYYLIFLNNGTMTIKDNENMNKIDTRKNKLFSGINYIIIGCVEGSLFTDVKKFKTNYFGSSADYKVELYPLDKTLSGYLKEIRIFFNKNTMTVNRIELQEVSGDFTKIEFSGTKTNNPISDASFIIK